MKFKFVRSEPVVSDVKSFIFEPQEPVKWAPGQYFHYVMPHDNQDDRGNERWFTCSAAPSEGHVMISTRINDKNSSFKKALDQLKPGTEIDADGPEGDFTVTDPDRNFIFVAFGIGITPYRSILLESANKDEKLKVTLLYANRNNGTPFKDELYQLTSKNSNLKIEYIIDPQQIDIELIKKHIDAVEKPMVYLSGPEPVVKDFGKQLEGIGMAKEDIKLDDFPGYETY